MLIYCKSGRKDTVVQINFMVQIIKLCHNKSQLMIGNNKIFKPGNRFSTEPGKYFWTDRYHPPGIYSSHTKLINKM